jgi:hypothetical protein
MFVIARRMVATYGAAFEWKSAGLSDANDLRRSATNAYGQVVHSTGCDTIRRVDPN